MGLFKSVTKLKAQWHPMVNTWTLTGSEVRCLFHHLTPCYCHYMQTRLLVIEHNGMSQRKGQKTQGCWTCWFTCWPGVQWRHVGWATGWCWLCRSRTCRSDEQIFWVNVVNGIISWTNSFLSQFSWAQPQACRPGVELPRLIQRTVRMWFTFALWFVHDSQTYCTQRTDAENVILVHILCWKWRCVTHPLTQGRGVDSRPVTVLLKLALCC